MFKKLIIVCSMLLSSSVLCANAHSPKHYCDPNRDVCVYIQTDASIPASQDLHVLISGYVAPDSRPYMAQQEPVEDIINQENDIEMFLAPSAYLNKNKSTELNVTVSVSKGPMYTMCGHLVLQRNEWKPETHYIIVSKVSDDTYLCKVN